MCLDISGMTVRRENAAEHQGILLIRLRTYDDRICVDFRNDAYGSEGAVVGGAIFSAFPLDLLPQLFEGPCFFNASDVGVAVLTEIALLCKRSVIAGEIGRASCRER